MSNLKENIIKYIKKTYEYSYRGDLEYCRFCKKKEINFDNIEKDLGRVEKVILAVYKYNLNI